jgi:drug/metabolite transporter (DMT)-like permease
MIYFKKQGQITHDNTLKIISHKELFIIALFDSTNSILQSIATPYLTISSMSIFNRLSLVGIPITSYIFLKTKYKNNHYLGIFLTIYGICITFIPNFLEHESLGNAWLILYIIGIIPSIASYTYKEYKLKQQPDIWWMNTYVCIYQLFIGFALLPINMLTQNLNFKQLGKQIGYGFVCQFANKNMQNNDHCNYAFWWFLLYSIFSFIMNALMLIIIRDGSSTLFVITNTLKTPITSFLGSFKVLAGKNTSQLTIADFFAFIILTVGSFVYNWDDEIKNINDVSFEEYQEIDLEKN